MLVFTWRDWVKHRKQDNSYVCRDLNPVPPEYGLLTSSRREVRWCHCISQCLMLTDEYERVERRLKGRETKQSKETRSTAVLTTTDSPREPLWNWQRVSAVRRPCVCDTSLPALSLPRNYLQIIATSNIIIRFSRIVLWCLKTGQHHQIGADRRVPWRCGVSLRKSSWFMF
jgi:hypothetical protein